MLPPYRPEPFTNFQDPDQRDAFLAALGKVKANLGKTYPLVIGGERIILDDVFPTINQRAQLKCWLTSPTPLWNIPIKPLKMRLRRSKPGSTPLLNKGLACC